MRKRRIVKLTALWMVIAAPLAAGGTFEWSGGGGNDFWNNGDNWDCVGACTIQDLYPDSNKDDGIIEETAIASAPLVIELGTNELADAVTIEASGSTGLVMHFESVSGTVGALTCDNIALNAVLGTVTLSVKDGANVLTVE